MNLDYEWLLKILSNILQLISSLLLSYFTNFDVYSSLYDKVKMISLAFSYFQKN